MCNKMIFLGDFTIPLSGWRGRGGGNGNSRQTPLRRKNRSLTASSCVNPGLFTISLQIARCKYFYYGSTSLNFLKRSKHFLSFLSPDGWEQRRDGRGPPRFANGLPLSPSPSCPPQSQEVGRTIDAMKNGVNCREMREKLEISDHLRSRF